MSRRADAAPGSGGSTGSWATGAEQYQAMAVFALVFANFFASAPRGIMLDDDGFFILAAWSGGVAHPPGYPLYTLLAGLAAQVPLGTVAFRVHLFSAVCGAGACAVLWLLVRSISASRLTAWIAAPVLGFSAGFWAQSTVAEVYALHVLLFLLLLWCCVRLRDNADSGVGGAAWVIIGAGIFGLSLTNHWPLTLLGAPALLVALIPAWRHVRHAWRSALMLFVITLVLPYLWMVYRSQVAEIAFHGPIRSVADLWYYISREPYRDIDSAAGAGAEEKMRYAWFSLQEATRQFGALGAVFAVGGFVRQWFVLTRSLATALTLAFAGNTLLLAALLGFEWDLLHRYTFSAYPLVAWAVMAIWIGLGGAMLAEVLQRQLRAGARLAGIAVTVLIAGTIWLQNLPANFRPADAWAANFAGAVLGGLQRNAALFLFGDNWTGPVGYLRLVEGVRPDVQLFSPMGLLFSNRLMPAHGGDPERNAGVLRDFVAQYPAPVYYNIALPHQHGVIAHGLVFEAARQLPAGLARAQLTPETDAYFSEMFARGEPRDTSQLIHHRQMTGMYCRTLQGLALGASAQQLESLLTRRCGGFHGLMERAAVFLENGPDQARSALALLQRAQWKTGESVTVSELATMDYLAGLAYHQTGNAVAARKRFQRAWRHWPDSSNPALAFIEETPR